MICSGDQTRVCSQSGVALAILLWFLAAMSVLVASIAYQARMDIKLAQLQLRKAQVQAAGDGAIQLAMADMLIRELDGESFGRGVFTNEFGVGDETVLVRIVPVGGLVDLNTASDKLLISLFTYVGNVGQGEAKNLAENVLKWRAPKRADAPQGLIEGAAESRHGRFESIEDLLLVRGVDRALFDRLKEAVYVAQMSQPGVDWRSAPESVLLLLGDGDRELVDSVTQFRSEEGGESMSVPAGLNTLFQEQQPIPLFRADAVVLGSDSRFMRRRWVDRTKAGVDGLPWRYFRTEPVRALGKRDNEWVRLRLEDSEVGS